MPPVQGIHHVTAIAADPQENLDFYSGVLGMRLVKRSVNQDDPGTYHLFYADALGTPGTDLTFFPWPQLVPTRPGVGLAVEVGLAVGPGALEFWSRRLAEAGVRTAGIETRFDEKVLSFRDPHGLPLALVETVERAFTPWDRSPVAPDLQVRGFHAVRIRERDLATTAGFLEEVLGFVARGSSEGWHRFAAEGGGSGALLEVRESPGERRGAWGTGGVHHVAWRVRDEAEQLAIRERVVAAGLRPTAVIDRFWFKSVYFLEPGGVLFELATEGPGFAIDEDPSSLGERLILPPWLEPQRRSIESALPPLRLPSAATPRA